MDHMKRNDLHLRGLGFEVRAVGPLAILAAVTVVALILLLARGQLF
jgi:hypothetical protein